jgi:hypothetical protein
MHRVWVMAPRVRSVWIAQGTVTTALEWAAAVDEDTFLPSLTKYAVQQLDLVVFSIISSPRTLS